jgi:hypothetical protein
VSAVPNSTSGSPFASATPNDQNHVNGTS